MSLVVEIAVLQWEEGYRRAQERRDPASQRTLERTISAIHTQLRKRLGSTFTVAELANLYQRGTDWCLEVALDLAPKDEPAPDSAAATDAAFYLYMREASDFAGGKVIETEARRG